MAPKDQQHFTTLIWISVTKTDEDSAENLAWNPEAVIEIAAKFSSQEEISQPKMRPSWIPAELPKHFVSQPPCRTWPPVIEPPYT